MLQTPARNDPKETLAPTKFRDERRTADGKPRAHIALRALDTLWFNTGTLCNITCTHCYIESSPTNDRLVYLTRAEVAEFLDEIKRETMPTQQIGFTGGEPFMNPDMSGILEDTLARGFEALVLTNAMQPMMRPKIREALIALNERFGKKMILRVSLDHYAPGPHDEERGAGGFDKTLAGLVWLSEHGFHIHVAGRTCWGEEEAKMRKGYAELFARAGVQVDCDDAQALLLFPEMDAGADVPEITEECWDILGVNPDDIMCASSRMVVKRKGAAAPVVLACTLLPYDKAFEVGATLKEAAGDVFLNHPHCARFCVLGGGSCTK